MFLDSCTVDYFEFHAEVLKCQQGTESAQRKGTDRGGRRDPISAPVIEPGMMLALVLLLSGTIAVCSMSSNRGALGQGSGSPLDPPTASYLTTRDGAGTPVTTPSDRALPVVNGAPAYPHSGGAALHGQGYSYQGGKASIDTSVPFPASYVAPGAPVPVSAPALGSFIEGGAGNLQSVHSFPKSGIGDNKHFWHSAVTPHPYTHIEHHIIHHHINHPFSPIYTPIHLPVSHYHNIFHQKGYTTPYNSVTPAHSGMKPTVATPAYSIPAVTSLLEASPKEKNGKVPHTAAPIYAGGLHSHYHVLSHPVLPPPHAAEPHIITVYPPVMQDTTKMPFVPHGERSPVQIVEHHMVHHHDIHPTPPAIHYGYSSAASYLPSVLPAASVPPLSSSLNTLFLQDLPESAQWIRPPSPKYRFGAGVPLTPHNGPAESTVHSLLPGVNPKEGSTAGLMYGTNSPKTYEDPHPPPPQPAAWHHQSSLANPMYQQTNPLGSDIPKPPVIPKYTGVM